MRLRSQSGMVAPHMAEKRAICGKFTMGMMPGITGIVTPAAAAFSMKLNQAELSKKYWVMAADAPRSCFIFR